jgi:tetratricopeptide (TPR) repeat protein
LEQCAELVESGDHSALRWMYIWARVYYRQGQYEEAELLFLKMLEIRQRVLGEEHPDTLDSLNNLIELYEAWGKPEKAKQWRAKLPKEESSEEE